MAELDTGVDSLHVRYTGGALNEDPNACLGGVASSKRVRGAGTLVVGRSIPGLRVDDASSACGFVSASVAVNVDGDLVFTGPSGAGAPVAIAEGEHKLLEALDPGEALRVYREVGQVFPPNRSAKNSRTSLSLVEVVNGPLSQRNVTSAQRVAGRTTYRAIALEGRGSYGVLNVKLWTPATVGAQATFYLGTEVPDSFGAIQVIPNEITAPTGVSWVHATAEGSAVVLPSILTGALVGLWIKRVFPAAGHVNPREDFDLAVKWTEG